MFFHKNTKKIIFVQIWVKMIFIRKFSYFMQKSDKNKQDKQVSKVSIRFFYLEYLTISKLLYVIYY